MILQVPRPQKVGRLLLTAKVTRMSWSIRYPIFLPLSLSPSLSLSSLREKRHFRRHAALRVFAITKSLSRSIRERIHRNASRYLFATIKEHPAKEKKKKKNAPRASLPARCNFLASFHHKFLTDRLMTSLKSLRE